MESLASRFEQQLQEKENKRLEKEAKIRHVQERARALESMKQARAQASVLEKEQSRAELSHASVASSRGGGPRFVDSARQSAVHKERMEAAMEMRRSMQAEERERAIEEAAIRRAMIVQEKVTKASEVERRRIQAATARREQLDAFAQGKHEMAVQAMEVKLQAIDQMDHVKVIENSHAHDEKKKRAIAVKAKAEALQQLRYERELERSNQPRPDPRAPLREAAEARRLQREEKEERVRARLEKCAVMEEYQRERYQQQYEEALAIGSMAAAYQKRGAAL